jgi:hypothetical protein
MNNHVIAPYKIIIFCVNRKANHVQYWKMISFFERCKLIIDSET